MAEAPDDEVNYYVDTIADVVRAEVVGLSMIAKLRAFIIPKFSSTFSLVSWQL